MKHKWYDNNKNSNGSVYSQPSDNKAKWRGWWSGQYGINDIPLSLKKRRTTAPSPTVKNLHCYPPLLLPLRYHEDNFAMASSSKSEPVVVVSNEDNATRHPISHHFSSPFLLLFVPSRQNYHPTTVQITRPDINNRRLTTRNNNKKDPHRQQLVVVLGRQTHHPGTT
jgi:hypothetical protein